MLARLWCLLALSYPCLSSPLGQLEKELAKERLDVGKLQEALKRASEEVEKEFAGKETQEELEKLRTAYNTASNGRIEVETALEIDGDPSEDLFEGDIVLTPEQWSHFINHDNTNLLNLHAITDPVKMWTPVGAPVIPYSYADGFPEDEKEIITESLEFWADKTCITFRPALATDENVLEFNHNSTRCASSVGMVGGRQSVDLAPGCFSVSIVTHELAHAFGVLHVQGRPDRDDFIILDTANIEKGKAHNFMKVPEIAGKPGNYGIPYEFGSLMHYDDKAFAINGSKPTIYARLPYSMYQGSMGSNTASFYDILLVNEMYKCTDKCEEKISCENNGVQDGYNCNWCMCPKGWEGARCNKRPINTKIVQLTDSRDIGMIVPAEGVVEKFYVIEAPEGKRINASVTWIDDYEYLSCDSALVEIIPSKDTRMNGIRFCGELDSTPIQTESNQMLVRMYNEKKSRLWIKMSFNLV